MQVPREVKVAEACTQVEAKIFPDVPDKKEVEVFMKISPVLLGDHNNSWKGSLRLVKPKSQENN